MWKFSWCSLYELHNSKARVILIVIRFNRVYLDQSSCWNLMKKGRNLNISHCSESDCCNIEWVGDEVHNIPPEKNYTRPQNLSSGILWNISNSVFLFAHISLMYSFSPTSQSCLISDHMSPEKRGHHIVIFGNHQDGHVGPATQARMQDSTGLGPAPRWDRC